MTAPKYARLDAIQQMRTRKWVIKINDKTLGRSGGGVRRYESAEAAIARGQKIATERGLIVKSITTKALSE